MTTATALTSAQSYILRAAVAFLASMEFYGQTYAPAAAPGGPATPAFHRSMLIKARHILGDYAALEAARDAAIARDGNKFHMWSIYADSIVARFK